MENEPIDIRGLPILQSGVLKGGETYSIVRLGPEHAAQVHALHSATVASLKPEEKVYMLPKSRDYIEHHMQKGGGNGALGVIWNGELIAQILVYHPTAADIDGMLAKVPDGVPPEELTILGGACVSKSWRGNGLMNKLVNSWIDHSAGWGRTHAAADIDVHNTASWAAFIRGGLSIESLMTDPRDGGTIYTAHERVDTARALRLTPEFNRHAGLPGISVGGADYDKQKELMDSGYNAVAWDRQGQSMLLKQLRPPSP